MERSIPTETAERLDAALARLDAWIDGSGSATATRTPTVIVPQLPVPPAKTPAGQPAGQPARTAADIVVSAIVSGAATATTLAVLVLAAMLLLPLPPRPSLIP